MFLDFFDTLKRKGIDVSMTEWLTLMDALDKGLIESSFTKFYYVSRMILVKSESDYDKFDMPLPIELNKGIKKVFNFDTIFRLYVDSWSNEEFATEPNCFCIKAEKSSENMICAFLGEYKTEERAKEVLEEIIELYMKCNCNSYGAGFGYVANTVFEMPAE